MSPRLRLHLITATLFVGVILVLAILWWLRDVFAYLLLFAVGAAVYYGLFLLVAARLRSRADGEERAQDDGLE